MSELSLNNIFKKYGELSILKNLSLSIPKGECVVLVGPSGCGKSTLLHALAGLIPLDGGEILKDKVDISAYSPKDRDMAMVFQSYALYPNMSVYENIDFGPKVRGVEKEKRKKIIQDVAKMLHLTPYLKRKPKELSGGQRQRVAIGRALARDCGVYLFDEPLSNLDAKLRMEMRSEIKKIHHRLKATMIYVTHDQIEAMTLADRMAVMNEGEILQFDTPDTIYHKPSCEFVASFIGHPGINLFTANLTYESNQTFVNIMGFPKVQTFEKKLSEEIYNKQINIGIRPFDISDKPLDQDFLKIEGSVQYVEKTGADIFVTIASFGKNFTFKSSTTPEMEDKMNIYLPVSKMHFFYKSQRIDD